jgi:hypothetical protein
MPYFVLIPLICGLAAQLLKFISAPRKLYAKTLISYGGMPSSHAALLSSLCTVIVLKEGASSIAFAIACITSVILLRDAFGLRMYLEKHGKTLNKIIAKLPKEEKKELPRHLEEKIGHKLSEVLAGTLIGVGLSLLLYYLFI